MSMTSSSGTFKIGSSGNLTDNGGLHVTGGTLSAAGVDVTLHRYDGMFHSFMSFQAELEEARALMAEIAGVLGNAFGHEGGSSGRVKKGISS